MTNYRIWLAAGCMVVGALQAWDSHALQAETFVQVLITVAILLTPIAILATPRTHIHLLAALCGCAILGLARLLSAVHLPELVLAAVFAGILAMVNHARTLAHASTPQA